MERKGLISAQVMVGLIVAALIAALVFAAVFGMFKPIS